MTLNGVSLKEGDGAAVSEIAAITVVADDRSEVLRFDLVYLPLADFPGIPLAI